MSELYTTLTRIKEELIGGNVPPMTPLTGRSAQVCRPEFTIGMGALIEDIHKGQQCPICGHWSHKLHIHLNATHKNVGGARGVKSMLSLPVNAPLVSAFERARQAEVMRKNVADGKMAPPVSKNDAHIRLVNHNRKRSRRTCVGTRNLKRNCERQIIVRLLAVRDIVRRSPSRAECDRYDPPLSSAAIRYFGTFNAAKAAAELKTFATSGVGVSRNKYAIDEVMEMFAAFFDAHGRLPTLAEGRSPTIPALPSRPTIYKHFGVRDWHKAMQKVAVRLTISGRDVVTVRRITAA